MLVYLDESGHPHPHDPVTRPVVVAICVQDDDARTVAGRIHALKRDVLGKERMEMKGARLITRPTFRRRPVEVAFVEEFFDTLLNLPVTIFAIIMERPTLTPNKSDNLLPNQYRFITQRVQLLAEAKDEMAAMLIDGSPSQVGGLSFKFESFLFRSEEGRACSNISEAPFFGDSRASAGVQIADMVASVVRLYEENQLFRSTPGTDPFLLAIRRYYRAIEQKTVDQTSHDGHPRPGLYRMPSTESALGSK